MHNILQVYYLQEENINDKNKTLFTRIKRLHKITTLYENTTETITQNDCFLWKYIQ